jgi:hypothetical protein
MYESFTEMINSLTVPPLTKHFFEDVTFRILIIRGGEDGASGSGLLFQGRAVEINESVWMTLVAAQGKGSRFTPLTTCDQCRVAAHMTVANCIESRS